MFEAVIFDWDGTLANTQKVVVESFQSVLQEVGCIVPNEFLKRRIGTGTRKMIEDALNKCNISFDKKVLEELSSKKIRLQTELSLSVTLFEGAARLLDDLHSRVRIALATMSARPVIDKLLTEKKIKSYFTAVVTASDISKPKPDPEIFLRAAEKLCVLPQHCVTVEDSIFGVKASKKAKMKCIAIPSGAYTKEELQKERPHLLVDSLTHTDEILNYINQTQPSQRAATKAPT
ncbi:MAG: HAD family phosphatase [Candidatus Bathyarchaeota archaeon]|nr:MAG: HAD family phosphatase [Candidatus Bathyarchaeota archaeon]